MLFCLLKTIFSYQILNTYNTSFTSLQARMCIMRCTRGIVLKERRERDGHREPSRAHNANITRAHTCKNYFWNTRAPVSARELLYALCRMQSMQIMYTCTLFVFVASRAVAKLQCNHATNYQLSFVSFRFAYLYKYVRCDEYAFYNITTASSSRIHVYARVF